MTPPCALCQRGCSVCRFFFTYRRRDRSGKKSRRRAGGSGATHAYRCITQHAPRTHRPSRPVSSIGNHRGRSEGRQSHAAEGWQTAYATSMTPPCALSSILQHADAGALCAVLFLLQTRPVSENRSCRDLGFGATHAHRTARPTHTLHIAPPVASIDSLGMIAVQHRSNTPSSSGKAAAAAASAAALVARAKFIIFLNPHLTSQRLVRSYFLFFNVLDFFSTSKPFFFNMEQTSERSDDVSPYLTVSCTHVPVTNFPECLPTASVYLIQIFFPPWCLYCVYWCVGASTLVHQMQPKEHGFRPRGRLWRPVFSGTTLPASKTVLNSSSLLVICLLIAPGVTGITGCYDRRLVVAEVPPYTFENIGYLHGTRQGIN